MRRGLRISGNRGNFVRFGVVDNHICLVVHTNRVIIIVHDKETVKLCESLLILLSELGRNNEECASIIRKVLGIVADIARIVDLISRFQ